MHFNVIMKRITSRTVIYIFKGPWHENVPLWDGYLPFLISLNIVSLNSLDGKAHLKPHHSFFNNGWELGRFAPGPVRTQPGDLRTILSPPLWKFCMLYLTAVFHSGLFWSEHYCTVQVRVKHTFVHTLHSNHTFKPPLPTKVHGKNSSNKTTCLF